MPRPTLTIVLDQPAAVRAQRAHLAHGALLVPLPDPAPRPLDLLDVRVIGPGGVVVEGLTARVVQVLPGMGLALALADPDGARAALAPLVAAAGDAPAPDPDPAPDPSGEAPAARSGETPAADDAEPAGTLYERIRSMPKAERRQLALRGDRAARLALIKSADKDVHQFVIQNPGLTLDEVQYIAGYRQTNPEVLKRIAESRDWVQNPRVLSNLVCNPKLPSPIAVRLLDRLPLQEIGRIARSSSTPPAVQAAARRKVIGG